MPHSSALPSENPLLGCLWMFPCGLPGYVAPPSCYPACPPKAVGSEIGAKPALSAASACLSYSWVNPCLSGYIRWLSPIASGSTSSSYCTSTLFGLPLDFFYIPRPCSSNLATKPCTPSDSSTRCSKYPIYCNRLKFCSILCDYIDSKPNGR